MRPYRLRDAVRAIGTTEAAVRQWLNSGKVTIDHGYGEGWATFTLRDIAVLAVTQKLVEFNVPLTMAFKIAGHAIDVGRKDVRDKQFARPGEEFVAGWKGILMTVRRDRKDPKAWNVTRWQKEEGEAPGFGNFICIDVATIVTEAFDRLEAGLVEPDAPDKKAKAG
jgi:hypothetical protein